MPRSHKSNTAPKAVNQVDVPTTNDARNGRVFTAKAETANQPSRAVALAVLRQRTREIRRRIDEELAVANKLAALANALESVPVEYLIEDQLARLCDNAFHIITNLDWMKDEFTLRRLLGRAEKPRVFLARNFAEILAALQSQERYGHPRSFDSHTPNGRRP